MKRLMGYRYCCHSPHGGGVVCPALPQGKEARGWGGFLALLVGLLVGTGVAPGAAGGVVEAGDGVPVGDLLITNVHLVPMDLERVLRDHALLVRGGTIAWLGPAREADRIRAGRTIDGGGAYVVPGLVDMHVHVRDEDELSLYLLNGVTTVVNQSGRLEHLEMRERIRAGWLTRLGRDAPAGQIATGRRADLVLVKRNPLEDISALRTLEGIVVRGRLVDLAELRARCDTRAAETGRLLEWYEAFKRETDGGALGEAEARVRSAPSGAFAEGVVNAVGYSHILRSRDVAKAVAVFEINTRVFPDSANAWDSLAEGLAEAGDRQGAIASYRKSLALNPDNDNAKRMIEKLQSEP